MLLLCLISLPVIVIGFDYFFASITDDEFNEHHKDAKPIIGSIVVFVVIMVLVCCV